MESESQSPCQQSLQPSQLQYELDIIPGSIVAKKVVLSCFEVVANFYILSAEKIREMEKSPDCIRLMQYM